MLKRRLPPEPYAAAADRSRACGLLGALLAAIAVVLGRNGAVDPRAALAVLGLGLLLALLAVALALWSARVIWRTGRRGTGRALAGFVLACVVLAYPAYLAGLALRLPAVDDVSTDPGAPPAFASGAAALAARGGVLHGEPAAEARDAARRAYPGLQPVLLDVTEDEAYRLALRAVQLRGWKVLEAEPPKGRFGTGHIDAVAPTRVMALPEDVTIRIRSAEGQARVDIRSASRFGRADGGTNAARIQSLSDELLDAAS